nr:uncharacterized protein LOC127324207 [Lolium perenne]
MIYLVHFILNNFCTFTKLFCSMENIIKRYQNRPAAQKRVHGRSLLKERRSKDCQVPVTTIDRRPSNDDMSIDESSISQLTIEQLSKIERELEYALRNTKARKAKAVLDESDLMKMVSRTEQASRLTHSNYS